MGGESDGASLRCLVSQREYSAVSTRSAMLYSADATHNQERLRIFIGAMVGTNAVVSKRTVSTLPPIRSPSSGVSQSRRPPKTYGTRNATSKVAPGGLRLSASRKMVPPNTL